MCVPTFDGNRDWVIETMYNDSGSQTGIVKIDWSYDADGRLTGESYDTGNNLTMSGVDYNDTFTYDLSGNRVEKVHDEAGTSNDDDTTYAYDQRDRLRTETSTLRGVTIDSYDANGSNTELVRTLGGSVVEHTKYQFDLANKLAKVDTNGDGTWDLTYLYDPAGNRVAEVTSGTSTYYVVDSNNPTGYAKVLKDT